MRWVVASLLVAVPSLAEPPITSRDYAIDFYEGAAVGNARMVGMGGAGLALIHGSAGTLLNPAASAIRATTDNDHWTWDWHLDYLNGQLSSDFDNNGVTLDKTSGAQLGTGGLSLRVGKWAGAFTLVAQEAPLDGEDLRAQNLELRFAAARWFPRIDTAIGLAVQAIAFRILGGSDEQTVFDIGGTGLVAGATWLPALQDFRVAVALETPIVGGKVSMENCDPMACMVGGAGPYILPNQVESSGRLGIGGAYRVGPTAWNQQVQPKFRDERALTIAADIWITGASKNGYGLEKFAVQEMQRSGADPNVSARLGAEVEALPGRLRLRAGTYWEPSRFDGVGGRLHGTFGVEVRVLEFRAWGLRRGRLGLLGDLAARYRNVGVSIGLWQ